jgi:hypothetical protein
LSTAWAILSRTAFTWVLTAAALDPVRDQAVLDVTSYTIDWTGGRAQLALGLALELRLGEA